MGDVGVDEGPAVPPAKHEALYDALFVLLAPAILERGYRHEWHCQRPERVFGFDCYQVGFALEPLQLRAHRLSQHRQDAPAP